MSAAERMGLAPEIKVNDDCILRRNTEEINEMQKMAWVSSKKTCLSAAE
jgi:hypothetical protein